MGTYVDPLLARWTTAQTERNPYSPQLGSQGNNAKPTIPSSKKPKARNDSTNRSPKKPEPQNNNAAASACCDFSKWFPNIHGNFGYPFSYFPLSSWLKVSCCGATSVIDHTPC